MQMRFALPNKNARYQYPRDVQTEVWNQWFARREEEDIVIRMNTGSGKTVVALLILKSCLNENKGPAVYIAPDPYLAQQVIKEAQQLGIEVTEDYNSLRFVR
jgi:replicative superfamily II helicase